MAQVGITGAAAVGFVSVVGELFAVYVLGLAAVLLRGADL
jgi:hypothetical protein